MTRSARDIIVATASTVVHNVVEVISKRESKISQKGDVYHINKIIAMDEKGNSFELVLFSEFDQPVIDS